MLPPCVGKQQCTVNMDASVHLANDVEGLALCNVCDVDEGVRALLANAIDEAAHNGHNLLVVLPAYHAA